MALRFLQCRLRILHPLLEFKFGLFNTILDRVDMLGEPGHNRVGLFQGERIYNVLERGMV
eukprot:6171679-Pyramimonas_sp.AAC.2